MVTPDKYSTKAAHTDSFVTLRSRHTAVLRTRPSTAPISYQKGGRCGRDRRLKKRSLLEVNEHFLSSPMPQMPPYRQKFMTLKS